MQETQKQTSLLFPSTTDTKDYSDVTTSQTKSNQFMVGEMKKFGPHYQNNVLFNTPEDTSHIQQLIVNYHCLIKHTDQTSAKDDFRSLVLYLYPPQTFPSVNNFLNQYFMPMSKEEKKQIIWQNMFKNPLYWKQVLKLPKITQNPKELAYMRTPFKDIFHTIVSRYQQVSWPEVKERTITIVVELSKDQEYKLMTSKMKYLMFTSFTKGFTNKETADQYIRAKINKSKNSNIRYYQFYVRIPSQYNLDKGYDFGFVINTDLKEQQTIDNGGNVIFNIYNFFKVIKVDQRSMSVNLFYGGFADVKYKFDKQDYRKKLDSYDNKLLDLYGQIQCLVNFTYDQGFAMALTGYKNDVLAYYDARITSLINQITYSQVDLDKIKFRKAQSLALNQQYSMAIITYLQINEQKLRVRGFIRILKICVQQRDLINAKKYLDYINPDMKRLRQWNLPLEYFFVKHYQAKIFIAEQNYPEAYIHYKTLLNDIAEEFAGRTSRVPLLKEIQKNKENSAKKIIQSQNQNQNNF